MADGVNDGQNNAANNGGNGNGDEAAGQNTLPFLSNIKSPKPLDLTSGKAENWKLWRQLWKNYTLISNLKCQTVEFKKAVFENCIGTDALKIYNTFVFTPDEENEVECDILDTILDKLDGHIIGLLNETYERYNFNTRMQLEDESFDSYITELRNLQKSCNFCQCLSSSLLRDKIVMGIRSDTTRKSLLEIQNLTLEKSIDICKANEASEIRMKQMHSAQDVNAVRHNKSYKSNKGKKVKDVNKCKFCNTKHVMKRKACPAWGKKCTACKQMNHFAEVCKLKKDIHTIDEMIDSPPSDCEMINGVHSVNRIESKLLFTKMLVDNAEVKFQIDSGASVNLIPSKYVKDADIQSSGCILQMWDGTKVRPLGETKVKIENPANGKQYLVKCVVIENDSLMPILGLSTCQKMNLIAVNENNVQRITTVKTQNLIEKYNSVFNNDVGCIPGTVKLRVDKNAKTSIIPSRRIPVALKSKVKEQLDKMEHQGVIMPVTEPTEWVSAMVVTTKRNNDLRICIDSQALKQGNK